ncbi:monooxygenase [Bizionia sediminis]|uniref:Monooxygenase n=1 Tax=Bizionia sediminis TaxID=1737064 RepID=A0ABW5KW50_9FLAO
MAVIMYVDFPHKGKWGDALAQEMTQLIESIVEEPGFIWKFWTENKDTQEAGGVYMFETKEAAENYLNMHTERLKSFGYTNIRSRIFNINQKLSKMGKAPL